jgi:hypothetical protein
VSFSALKSAKVFCRSARILAGSSPSARGREGLHGAREGERRRGRERGHAHSPQGRVLHGCPLRNGGTWVSSAAAPSQLRSAAPGVGVSRGSAGRALDLVEERAGLGAAGAAAAELRFPPGAGVQVARLGGDRGVLLTGHRRRAGRREARARRPCSPFIQVSASIQARRRPSWRRRAGGIDAGHRVVERLQEGRPSRPCRGGCRRRGPSSCGSSGRRRARSAALLPGHGDDRGGGGGQAQHLHGHLAGCSSSRL